MFVDRQAMGPSSASVMGNSPIASELTCFGFLVARFGSRALQIEAACKEGLRLYGILSSHTSRNINMREQSCDITFNNLLLMHSADALFLDSSTAQLN